jgi:hypothetical protein
MDFAIKSPARLTLAPRIRFNCRIPATACNCRWSPPPGVGYGRLPMTKRSFPECERVVRAGCRGLPAPSAGAGLVEQGILDRRDPPPHPARAAATHDEPRRRWAASRSRTRKSGASTRTFNRTAVCAHFRNCPPWRISSAPSRSACKLPRRSGRILIWRRPPPSITQSSSFSTRHSCTTASNAVFWPEPTQGQPAHTTAKCLHCQERRGTFYGKPSKAAA